MNGLRPWLRPGATVRPKQRKIGNNTPGTPECAAHMEMMQACRKDTFGPPKPYPRKPKKYELKPVSWKARFGSAPIGAAALLLTVCFFSLGCASQQVPRPPRLERIGKAYRPTGTRSVTLEVKPFWSDDDPGDFVWPPDGLAHGFRLYYGTESRTGQHFPEWHYPFGQDLGNVTTATVSGLDPALPYYFAATAYVQNPSGDPMIAMETDYSDEMKIGPSVGERKVRGR
jgi:hypothetical protein